MGSRDFWQQEDWDSHYRQEARAPLHEEIRELNEEIRELKKVETKLKKVLSWVASELTPSQQEELRKHCSD